MKQNLLTSRLAALPLPQGQSVSNYRVARKWVTGALAGLGLFAATGAFAQVEVTATGGTPNGNYTSVNDAFAAINAGTHQGAITIAITGNTTEPAAVPLVASGQGAAVYSSVLIQPTVAATITGTPAASRAVIELNGADNVTIDGDAPGGGVGRDLTIVNAAANTVVSAVIRLIGATTGGLGTVNNTIQNTVIVGNLNTAATSVTPQFGIYAGGTTPTTSMSSTGTGADYDNLTIRNNEVKRTQIGIHVGGTTANQADNLLIENNLIGSNSTADYVNYRGIALTGVVNPVIQNNTIFNVKSTIGSSSSGIELLSTSTNLGATISRNTIFGVHNLNTGGWAANGINLNGGNNHLVVNNEVYDILGINYSSVTTTFTAHGIRASAGTGHRIYYNSVNLFGQVSVGTSPSTSVAMSVTSTSVTGLDIRNNIFQNKQVSTTTGFKAYAVRFASGYAFATSGLVMNNNAYFVPSANTSTTSYFVGGTYASTVDAQNLAAWAALTQTAAPSNDTQSIPTVNQTAPFTSDTNLAIPAGTTTLLESGGVVIPALGIPNTDIDTTPRPTGTNNGTPNSAPDMGAYEFNGTLPAFCTGAPAAGTITGTNSLCSGTGTTLSHSIPFTADLGLSYQWAFSTTPGGPYTNTGASSGGPSTLATGNLTQTTYYVVTATCSNSGQTSTTQEFTVTVIPNPVVSVTPATTTGYCSPGSAPITLTASGADAYTWTPATGLSATTGASVSASPVSTTTYTVTGTTNGCTGSATASISVVPGVLPAPTATPSAVCAGGSSQLDAGVFCPAGIKITEVLVNRGGTGSNATYPSYAPAADIVEISNLSNTDYNAGGLIIQSYVGTALERSFAVPAGTILPANSVMLIAFATGTDNAANRYFNTGGTNDAIFSSTLVGFVLKSGSNVVDAVALNSYVFPAVSGVSASDWSGNITSNSGRAGVIRTGATDTNTAADWVPANSPTPLQTIGTYNGGYTTVANECTGYTYVWSPATGLSSTTVANPIASGIATTTTYTVTATAPNGCSGTGTVTVTAGSPLTVTAAVAPTTICAGQNASLTATVTGGGAPYTYQWTGPNGYTNTTTGTTSLSNTAPITSAPVAASGLYTISVSDACGATQTATVNLTVNPLPTAVPSSNTPVCEGNTLTLTGTTDIGSSYTWTGPNSFSSSSQNPIIGNVTLAAAGTYTFRASHNGCTSPVGTTTVQILDGVTNPTASATPGTVCAGETINLSSSGTVAGYTMDATCSTGFIDISATGTAVTSLGDDTEHNLTLPFSFTFNGTNYTTARVGSNGALVFGSTTGDITHVNACLPVANFSSAGTPGIAAFWDDLDLTTVASTTSSITTAQVGSTYIVQWTNMGHDAFQGGTLTFQIQLEQNTNKVTLVYQDVDLGNASYNNGLSATVGLNLSATSAQQFSCNTASLTNGQCISFTPVSVSSYSWTGPNGFTSTDQNPVIANATAANSGTYTVTFANAGGCTNTATATVTVNSVPVATASSNSPVTEGGTIMLMASGGTSYTWTGPNGFTSFSQNPTISGATLADAGVYTVSVSDGNCGATATTTVVVNPAPTTLNGVYTINDGALPSATNFISFSSAVSTLNTLGVNGPVTFNVVPTSGPYNETVVLSQIPGSSATNTVTFNGNGAVLNGCATSANRAIIRLDGTDNIAINGLTINATCNFGWGFHLMGDVSNVTISNNTINLSASQSVFIGSMAGIVATNSATNPQSPGGMINGLTVSGNTIVNGYHGIRIEGMTGGLGTGLVVSNNTLTTPMGYGIDVRNMSNPTVSGNDLAMRTGAGYLSNNSAGIVVINTENGLTVNANSVHSAGITGLMLQNISRTTTARGMVANNMIGGNFQNTQVVHAAQLNNASYLDIYYNSTWADNGASGSGFYVSNQFSRFLDAQNNSFAYTGPGTGYAMQANNGNSNFTTIDNNNYYSTSARFVRYAGADRQNLAQLQVAPNGQNMQSMSANPMYVSNTNLHLQAGSPLIGQAAALAAVTVDYDGDARTNPTDIGADEYMVTVRTTATALNAEVYPNPFAANLTVKLNGETAGDVQIVLTDLMGRQVMGRTFSVEAGVTALELNVDQELAQGVYLLQVTQGEATAAFRVVKQ